MLLAVDWNVTFFKIKISVKLALDVFMEMSRALRVLAATISLFYSLLSHFIVFNIVQ